MALFSRNEDEVGALIARIGTLFERAHAAHGARPARAELDQALADGYACVMNLEAERVRIARRSTELFAAGRASRAAARELRTVNARLFERDREIARLRALLAELREDLASAAPVAN
jgi:hypothetical protein